jgi:ankyrin repeat protein
LAHSADGSIDNILCPYVDCEHVSSEYSYYGSRQEPGQQEGFKHLLKTAMDGVDPDFKDNSGRTPLWSAARNGHEAVVNLLLAKDGVDPDYSLLVDWRWRT